MPADSSVERYRIHGNRFEKSGSSGDPNPPLPSASGMSPTLTSSTNHHPRFNASARLRLESLQSKRYGGSGTGSSHPSDPRVAFASSAGRFPCRHDESADQKATATRTGQRPSADTSSSGRQSRSRSADRNGAQSRRRPGAFGPSASAPSEAGASGGGADRRGRGRGLGRSLETLGQATYSQPADWVVDWSVSDPDSSTTPSLGRNETETIFVAEQQAIMEQLHLQQQQQQTQQQQPPVTDDVVAMGTSPAVDVNGDATSTQQTTKSSWGLNWFGKRGPPESQAVDPATGSTSAGESNDNETASADTAPAGAVARFSWTDVDQSGNDVDPPTIKLTKTPAAATNATDTSDSENLPLDSTTGTKGTSRSRRKPAKRESDGDSSLPTKPSRGSSPIPSRRASVAALSAATAHSNRQSSSAAAAAAASAAAINRSLGSPVRHGRLSPPRAQGPRQRLQSKSQLTCDSLEPHQCPSSNMAGNGNASVDVCYRRHYDEARNMPYLWRVKYGEKWIPLSSINVEIERAYCQPENLAYSSTSAIELEDGNSIELFYVNFERMTSTIGPVERLSTPSYVTRRDKVDATQWRWYWQFGDQWILYKADEPPYQDVLEAKYLDDRTQVVSFQMNGVEQLILFSKMTQLNMDYRRTIGISDIYKIKRRPLFVGPDDVIRFSALTSVPPAIYYYLPWEIPNTSDFYWSPMKTNRHLSGPNVDVVPLQSAPITIFELFHESMKDSEYRILGIHRIQNVDSWNNYVRQKEQMEENMPPDTQFVKERCLFRGVSSWSAVLRVVEHNFQTVQTPYAVGADDRGVLLANSADHKLAHRMTNLNAADGSQRRHLILSRVLIGRSAKAELRSHLISQTTANTPSVTSPASVGGNSDIPDSYVDDVDTPREYVIPKASQIYPSYIIAYVAIEPPVSDTQTRPPPTRTPLLGSCVIL